MSPPISDDEKAERVVGFRWVVEPAKVAGAFRRREEEKDRSCEEDKRKEDALAHERRSHGGFVIIWSFQICLEIKEREREEEEEIKGYIVVEADDAYMVWIQIILKKASELSLARICTPQSSMIFLLSGCPPAIEISVAPIVGLFKP
ncbi:Purple acid phosphatase 3 [Senna tora]|uniref:Purple acid phosphatase 3 n=1 Tax=Senna tora TaxID=362788 RepID=A0A834W920_9FABA|nr:Purple acid phosphatase 3 [Senna tora]